MLLELGTRKIACPFGFFIQLLLPGFALLILLRSLWQED